MGFTCKIFGHKWNGCKCERCGKIRGEQHDWEKCICKRCGTIRDTEHNYKPMKHQFRERCSVCGNIKLIKDAKCEKCGIPLSSVTQKENEINQWQKRNNVGIILGSPYPFLIKCPKCDKITCSNCFSRFCPFCKELYRMDTAI